MELVITKAISAQLGTPAEHSAMLAKLKLLTIDPQRLGPDVEVSAADPGSWTVRLAVAPWDQLAPHPKPESRQAA